MADKRFDPEKAQSLMREERRKALPPEETIKHLQIDEHDTVADLGAGNGYFAIPIAKQTDNQVYAIDIEPKMLEMLKDNAAEAQVANIQYVESDLNRIQLDDDVANKVMISLVMHEVPNPDQTLEEIRRILQPAGKMLVIDWEAVEMEDGPPLHHRISSRTMKNVLERNGFHAEVITLSPEYYAVKAIPQ